MRNRTFGAALLGAGVAAAFALAANPAFACKGKTVKFSDDFRQVDDSWPVGAANAVSVEDGKVKIKANESASYNLLYGGSLFQDADICVTAQVPNKMDKPEVVSGGPIFWAEDPSNFYTFSITPDGRAGIIRLVKGKWIYVVAYRQAQGINGKPGDKNVLRVTTSGGSITAYINDVKFASVKAQAPDNGGQIGLHAESEPAHRDTWKFMNLKVTDLPQ